MEQLFILFTAYVCHEILSVCICASFSFDFEDGMLDMIVLFLIIVCLFTLIGMLLSFCVMHLFLYINS